MPGPNRKDDAEEDCSSNPTKPDLSPTRPEGVAATRESARFSAGFCPALTSEAKKNSGTAIAPPRAFRYGAPLSLEEAVRKTRLLTWRVRRP